MKVFRVIAALAAISAFAILVQTQTRPAGPAAPQVRPASGPANVAVIDSAAFSDDKTGITRVMNAMKQIETKFQPLRTEIRGMRDRLTTMRADIQKKQSIQDPKMTAQQADEADRLEVQIKRKAEDAQASYQKESLAVLDPMQKEIGEALTAYAQSKGISLLIDLNRVPVIYSAPSLDITKEFIAEYNRTAKKDKKPPLPDQGHMIDVGAMYRDMDIDVLREVRTKNKSDLHRFQRSVQAHIDQGVPLLWTVMLGKVPETGIPQNAGGHMRLIIGYNTAKDLILYSDSWGPGHERKIMSASDAWTMTTGAMSIEPFAGP